MQVLCKPRSQWFLTTGAAAHPCSSGTSSDSIRSAKLSTLFRRRPNGLLAREELVAPNGVRMNGKAAALLQRSRRRS